VFDHVAIAVADLAASERFYRTVLSVLGAEPKYVEELRWRWPPCSRSPEARLRSPTSTRRRFATR
jgi:catechol 2,3-dioxygenase-like lactoylglutathione lyase family enzyme